MRAATCKLSRQTCTRFRLKSFKKSNRIESSGIRQGCDRESSSPVCKICGKREREEQLCLTIGRLFRFSHRTVRTSNTVSLTSSNPYYYSVSVSENKRQFRTSAQRNTTGMNTSTNQHQPTKFSNQTEANNSIKSYCHAAQFDVSPTKDQAIVIHAIDTSLQEYAFAIGKLIGPQINNVHLQNLKQSNLRISR